MTLRRWGVRAAAFAAAGLIGGLGVAALVDATIPGTVEWVPVVLGAGAASPVTALPTWAMLCRNDRRGPAWGALAGAWAPVLIGLVVIVTSLALLSQPARRSLAEGGLFYLLLAPLTLALAAAGAGLGTDRAP